jgi:hypothetical protein
VESRRVSLFFISKVQTISHNVSASDRDDRSELESVRPPSTRVSSDSEEFEHITAPAPNPVPEPVVPEGGLSPMVDYPSTEDEDLDTSKLFFVLSDFYF